MLNVEIDIYIICDFCIKPYFLGYIKIYKKGFSVANLRNIRRLYRIFPDLAQFTVHDLRRTFITVAESLDIPAYALKRLLNHKMGGDVTAGYIMSDVEQLRRPMMLITDYLFSRCTEETQNVVELGAFAKEISDGKRA